VNVTFSEAAEQIFVIKDLIEKIQGRPLLPRSQRIELAQRVYSIVAELTPAVRESLSRASDPVEIAGLEAVLHCLEGISIALISLQF
jgi:hypothetical protein